MTVVEERKVLETKVVMLGQTGVGKTSMVNRYVHGQFLGNTTATIGAAFMRKEVLVQGGAKVVLQLWDTAGQERFRSMAPRYYRNAHAALLVFDATDPSSLEKVKSWVKELQMHASNSMVLVIASNKSDLRDANPNGCVPYKQAQEYARQIGASLFQTSAKTGRGIDELFKHIAQRLLERSRDITGYIDGNDNEENVVLDEDAARPAQGSQKSQGSCCK